MNSTNKSKPILAVTVVIVIVGAALGGFYVGTVTGATTRTSYTTNTIIAGTTTLTNFSSGRLYDVTFKEGDGCGGYIDQWGVQLGNFIVTQPPNIQLSQISENGFNSSGRFNLTTITFSVPSGTYPFTVYPTTWLKPAFNNTSIGNIRDSAGTVTLSNSSVTIDTISVEVCA